MHANLAILLTCCACAGQSITVGVVGGGRVTDDVTSLATPESKRYVVGPSIEFGLPRGFTFEFDALYHRVGYELVYFNATSLIIGSDMIVSPQTISATLTDERGRANSWEFPLLLKYKLSAPVAKPFVMVGIAPRAMRGTVVDSVITVPGESSSMSSSGVAYPADVGIVAGGGVQLSIGRLRISPQVRYTHWTSTPISDPYFVLSTRNQLDVLAGIGWKF